MISFLIPLLLGFGLNAASTFTTAYSHRWGREGGRTASMVLRDILGIPLWVIGLSLAIWTPSPAVFAPNRWAEALGWILMVAASLLILWALLSLGWRAAAPSIDDTLVVSGPYAHVRHPIYDGLFLDFIGLFLITPTVAVAIACLIGMGWIPLQARLEEVDLIQRAPDYREYMRQVPPFWPRRSKIKSPTP